MGYFSCGVRVGRGGVVDTFSIWQFQFQVWGVREEPRGGEE